MAVEVKPHPRFLGVYWATLEDGSRRLATVNLAPGKKKGKFGNHVTEISKFGRQLW